MHGACSARVVAARPIGAGEDVCICYSSAACFQPRAARQSTLTGRWGFACRCARCEGSLPADEAELWATLEAAAAVADAARPRQREVDPAVAEAQRRAAAAVQRRLPHLAEGERFAEDAAYFAA